MHGLRRRLSACPEVPKRGTAGVRERPLHEHRRVGFDPYQHAGALKPEDRDVFQQNIRALSKLRDNR